MKQQRLVCGAVVLLFACQGEIGSSGSTSDPVRGPRGGDVQGDSPPIRDAAPGTPAAYFPGTARAATPARFWRLTWTQYDEAASALVGERVQPSAEFDAELLSGSGYLNEQRFLEATDNLALQFGQAAEALAERMAASLRPCAAADRRCVEDFVASQGRRIWRRPLSGEELQRYAGVYSAAAAELGDAGATSVVLEALLSSPFFLFRSEVGDPGDAVGEDLRLSPHEIASALSFALWNAPPDDALSGLADSGALREPVVLAEHAQRLLDDPRAVAALFEFLSQWLGFFEVEGAEKDVGVFPEWTETTGQAMLDETRAFVSDVLSNGGGFAALMTDNHSFPGPELAWIYDQPTDGSRIITDERMGLLMQPSYLTAHAKQAETSPTARGVFAVTRLGCYHPPPPDPNIASNPPPPDRSLTTRQRFELHQSDPVCGTCHRTFDPIGLAFESFDAVGRFRTEEHGLPLDLAGELPAGVLADEALPFEEAADVALAAADSSIVHQCFVRNMFQYIYGREPVATDDPVLRAGMDAFVQSDLDPRALLLALVTHPEFILRHAAE